MFNSKIYRTTNTSHYEQQSNRIIKNKRKLVFAFSLRKYSQNTVWKNYSSPILNLFILFIWNTVRFIFLFLFHFLHILDVIFLQFTSEICEIEHDSKSQLFFKMVYSKKCYPSLCPSPSIHSDMLPFLHPFHPVLTHLL